MQKPHWRPPATANAWAKMWRSRGSRPSSVTTCFAGDLAGGHDARRQRAAVHEHGAAAARPLGRAAVLRRDQAGLLAQDVHQRRAVVDARGERRAVQREGEVVRSGGRSHGFTPRGGRSRSLPGWPQQRIQQDPKGHVGGEVDRDRDSGLRGSGTRDLRLGDAGLPGLGARDCGIRDSRSRSR